MLPALFATQEEMVKKMRGIAKVHDFKNAHTISHIFYDVFKVAYYAVKRKKEKLKSVPTVPVLLKRKDVTRLVKLIDYHHGNDTTHTATHELLQCFGAGFTENDALKFFENFVEGDTNDRFGRSVHISLEDGIKFMYKNYQTGTHEIKSEYYQPHRGKRLPWIRHTLHNSKNIYTRIDGQQREIMYLSKYDLPTEDESRKQYWVVIVKKYKKDRVGPYHFKTAFPMFRYNDLLRRLERYRPIIDVPK